MNLKNNPFLRIKSGLKTVEMRLDDERRKNINIGDKIEFTNEDTGETLTCTVTSFSRFSSFVELYNNFNKIDLGYRDDEEKNPSDMLKYYDEERIKKYGVLAIGIELDSIIKCELKDDQFIKRKINHDRKIARAFVLDENNNLALHVIKRKDIFGRAIYYETPGGGIDDNETSYEAIKRECREELGYIVEVVKKIAIITDYYNLLKRRNIQDFYICRRLDFVGKHFVSWGDSCIKETLWVPVEKAFKLYDEGMKNGRIGTLVTRRETIPLKEVKKYLGENNEN